MLGIDLRAKKLSWMEVGNALSSQISKVLNEPLCCDALLDDPFYWDVRFPKPGLSIAQISTLLEYVDAGEGMHCEALSFASDHVTTSTSIGTALSEALLKCYLQLDWDRSLSDTEGLCLIGIREQPLATPERIIQIGGKRIFFDELKSKDELLSYLKENGASHSSLMDFCEEYMDRFGNELNWSYPISDGIHHGTFLVLVREGVLSLPYNQTDSEDYELFCVDDATLFQYPEDMQVFIDDWHFFDTDLRQAMYAMSRYLKEQEEV